MVIQKMKTFNTSMRPVLVALTAVTFFSLCVNMQLAQAQTKVGYAEKEELKIGFIKLTDMEIGRAHV